MNAFVKTRIAHRSLLGSLCPTGGMVSLGVLIVCVGFHVTHLLAQGPIAPLGAVLLKNDRVLLGQVEPRGDSFAVHIADSSQVSIPKLQVQYVGRDVNDLYAYKVRSLANPNTGDHFKLTRWCMANNLLDEAVKHYQFVVKEAGDHPKVKQLAVELKNQLLEVPEFRSYLGLPPQVAALTASAVQPASLETAGDSLSGQVVVASVGVLESPPHPLVVSRFGERLQPILINRCSQAACHGGQASNALKLLEPHSKFYAETSASNLSSVLPYAEPDANNVTPLLAYATKAHGLQRQPGIAITETAIVAELRAWVELVRNPVVSAEATDVNVGWQSANGSLLPVARGAERLKRVPQNSESVGLDRIEFPDGSAPPTDSELESLERQIERLVPPKLQSGEAGNASQRSDPFDPAEFNRQVQRQAGGE